MTAIASYFPVGIYFSDNDFCNTMWPFMRALQKNIDNLSDESRKDKEFMRKHIVKIYNETIFAYYIMHQHDHLSGAPFQHLQTYLKISERDVFLDKEVFEKESSGGMNYTFAYFYYLDGSPNII